MWGAGLQAFSCPPEEIKTFNGFHVFFPWAEGQTCPSAVEILRLGDKLSLAQSGHYTSFWEGGYAENSRPLLSIRSK